MRQVQTFLFSDVEGSTALLRSIGTDAFGAFLVEHHRLLADAAGVRGGVVESTEGDGAFVLFSSASAAVAAALEAQLSFASHQWELTEAPRVRMGIHAGEAERREGHLVGLAIHQAARIAAAANGGQVLVSEAAAVLVGDELPGGAGFADLGCYQLKDLPGDHRLFRLYHPALAEDVRPPRVSQAARTNLPAPRSTFVGRNAELAEVRELVHHHRLVTIVGPGGAGKTRLALSVSSSFVGTGYDGVWLVELADIANAEDVATSLASSLGLLPGPDPIEVVTRQLSDSAHLIVLDNCEHVIEEAARVVTELLDGCPNLKILATSREQLAVPGEELWRIPGLSLPDANVGPDAIEASDAVQLFLVRAQSASARITAGQLGDVADLCRRLDGIPLAIELAAARSHVFSPRQIAERLDDAFRILAGRGRGRNSRQSTLRATIAWSHDLLDSEERVLFRRLAVFAGWFSLDDVEMVCGDDRRTGADVVDMLANLVDKSIVVVDVSAEERRFRLLDTVRQFAAEMLAEAGETVGFRSRHLDWYVQLVGRLAPLLEPPHHERLRVLEREEPNIDAALAWAAETNPRAAENIVAHLGEYWFSRARMHEMMEWCDRLLGIDDGIDSPERVHLMLSASSSLRESGAPVAGIRTLLERATAMSDRLDDLPLRAFARTVVEILPGADVGRMVHEALVLARQAGNGFVLCQALQSEARQCSDSGRLEDAAALLIEALAITDVSEQLDVVESLLTARGDLELRRGRPAEALRLFQAVHDLIPRELNEQNLSICLVGIGAASLDLGALDVAFDAYAEAFILINRSGNLIGQSVTLAGLAAVASSRATYDVAAKVLGAARAVRLPVGMRPSSLHGYDVAERVVRDALGDAFDTLTAEGATLSISEAAALAGITVH
jgi:predicted ATPase/class 3 adenylate cyclase